MHSCLYSNGVQVYKRTKYKVPYYPYYGKAYRYYHLHVENSENEYWQLHEAWISKFEDWLEAQGAHFHRRDLHMNQNHNIFFATDEQRVIFLLKVSSIEFK